jgi:hypothetical protein
VLTSFQSLSKADAETLETAITKTMKDTSSVQCIGAYVFRHMAAFNRAESQFSGIMEQNHHIR